MWQFLRINRAAALAGPPINWNRGVVVSHPLYTPCRGFISLPRHPYFQHPQSTLHSESGGDTFTARGWSLFSLVVTMCSNIPLQHICVVQGVSSADVARDVGFGVVQPSQQDTQNSTHIFTPDVSEGLCFVDEVGWIVKDVFLCLHKCSVLNKCV